MIDLAQTVETLSLKLDKLTEMIENLSDLKASSAPAPKRMLTVAESARYLHITRQTLNAWIRRGYVSPRVQPSGRRMIRITDLQKINQNEI